MKIQVGWYKKYDPPIRVNLGGSEQTIFEELISMHTDPEVDWLGFGYSPCYIDEEEPK